MEGAYHHSGTPLFQAIPRLIMYVKKAAMKLEGARRVK
jgi:hypothetical protein